MRTFIAIALSEGLRKELFKVQERLRQAGGDVKWVGIENIHLTLKFLGEIEEIKAEELKHSLVETVKKHKPFEIGLSNIGAFPKISYPNIIWIGIGLGAKECEMLYKDIENSTAGLGFQKEARPFSPHLTLGRVRSPKNRERLIGNLEKEKGFGSFEKSTVDKIILFQSTLTPSGPIYSPLKEFPLI